MGIKDINEQNPDKLTINQLYSTITVGFAMGVIAVITSVSFGALIFTEELAKYLPIGIGLCLFSTIMVGGISTIKSAYPGMIAGTQHTTVVILNLALSAMAVTLVDKASEKEILFTIIAAIIFNSFITGLIFFSVGWFQLGELIRFIPYPVVAGFLSGTGWLLIAGVIHTTVHAHIDFWHLYKLFEPEILLHWLPGVIFGVILFISLHRTHNLLVVPAIVLGVALLFYVFLKVEGISIDYASEHNWLIGSHFDKGIWEPISLSALIHANWPVVFKQTPTFATIWIIDLIGLLFGVSTIELAVKQDINLNHELKTAGIASLVSGLGGGISGYPLPSDTALIYKLKSANRLVGLIAAGFAFIVLLFGTPLLALCPSFIVGGILFLLGIDLLIEWVYEMWFKLPKPDFAIIVLILFIIIAFGFIQGVLFGVIGAFILFVISYSQVSVTKHSLSGSTFQSHVQRLSSEEQFLREQGEQIYILELQGLIFFGTAHKLLEQIRQRLQDLSLPPLLFLILDFRLVRGLDTSAVLSFIKLKQMANQHKFVIILTHLAAKDEKQLKQGGYFQANDNICSVFQDLDRGLEWCENQILYDYTLSQSKSITLSQQLKTVFEKSEDIEQMITYLKPINIEAGELLFKQGDLSDGLYFLESGQVTVVIQLSEQKTKRLRTYNSGTILGEIGLYTNATRSASVMADEPSQLYHLSNEAFKRIEQENPQLAANFHKFIVNLLANRLKLRENELRKLLK